MSIKANILKTDNSLPNNVENGNIKQNFAYKKKILHKINNFSVNIKDYRKSALSSSPEKKKNNSSFYN